MTNRTNFLSNLLGRKGASDVKATLKQAERKLDGAKVSRKALRRWKQEGDAAALVAVVTDTVVSTLADSGAVEAIVASPDTEEESPEEVKTQVEDAVATAIDAVVEDVTVTPEAADAASEVSAEDMTEMKALVKSLGELVGHQAEDGSAIANAVVEIASAIKELRAEMREVKTAIGRGPRQASKSHETTIEGDDLLQKIKEGLDGETTFLGVKVKPLANGNGNGKRS